MASDFGKSSELDVGRLFCVEGVVAVVTGGGSGEFFFFFFFVLMLLDSVLRFLTWKSYSRELFLDLWAGF